MINPTKFLTKLNVLIHISRPRFWLYTAGSFLLGYICGLPSGFHGLYPIQFWVLFGFFLFPANLYLYGINDLFDRATDELNAKKDGKEHRLQPNDYRVLALSLGIVAVMAIGILWMLPVLWRGLFVLFAALCTAYSAPPLRFKVRPIADSYSNVLYVLPGFLGYAITTGNLPPLSIIIAAWLWAAGMHAYSAIPDITPDLQAGLRTIAVMLGKNGTLLFVGSHWLVSAILTMATIGWIGSITLLYPLIIAAIYRNPKWSVERVYWAFPFLNAGIGFLAYVVKTFGS